MLVKSDKLDMIGQYFSIQR